jgi:hypothetical protein
MKIVNRIFKKGGWGLDASSPALGGLTMLRCYCGLQPQMLNVDSVDEKSKLLFIEKKKRQHPYAAGVKSTSSSME